jgi:bifunctional non-homologous end joining protein LigD
MVIRKKKYSTTAGIPAHISPMLCTLTKDPVQSEDYIFEIKWDGYRIISTVEDNRVRMSSRGGMDYTARYPLITEALKGLGRDLVIDGEVVVMGADGRPDFDALQLYNAKRSPIRYCVFDLLYLEGNSLMELPLYQRKELLEALVGKNEIFLFSESFSDGNELYENAVRDNLEGIVAKKKDSIYQPGARGYDWLKVPTRKRQEFVIGGWAESDKSRSFKSLLFGAYENDKLMWIGRSGGGYKQAEMPGILKQLEAIEIKDSPFENKILDSKGAKNHFIRPILVANFEFATWTKSGRIRKPATFLGFRKDKNPKDVVREVPVETDILQEVIGEQLSDDKPLHGEQLKDNKSVPKKGNAKAALDKYNQKRSFDVTPEPEGGSPDSEKLVFVVQKHNASHLHYDFRLEIRGVLKSWAVPKGPSMDPKDHRLAMEVEDHPYDYKDFEGIIPEGQYGGGTVLVWDNGTYEPAEPIDGKKEQEHWLLSNYYKNKLSIILHGKKLKGKFNLIRAFGKAENAWMLTKAKDGDELDTDITKRDQSVLSGYTILEVAMDSHSKVWQSNRESGKDEGSKTDNAEAELDAELAGPEVPDVTVEDSGNRAAELTADIRHARVGALFPKAENKRSTRSKASLESNWNRVFEEKIKTEGSIPIEKQLIHLTNIEKKLWKTTNKASLISYYNSISRFILPHLKDRPLSLHIKNISAGAPGFYIKDMEGFQPDFMDVYTTKRKHKVQGKAEIIDYAVCNNLPSLLWLINLGCIDLNPWNSAIGSPDEPDFIAIDLDPSDGDFKKAVKTAQAAKAYFDENSFKAFIKTSGQTGIHIFLPCSGYSFPQARSIAEHICGEIQKRVPKISTIEVSVDKRGNKLFVDFSQNDPADTLAAAYSVRPAKQPCVSAPIQWEELDTKLKPTDFTIENMPARLQKIGDIWEDLHEAKNIKLNNRFLSKIMGW